MTQEQENERDTLYKKMQKLTITWKDIKQKPVTILVGVVANKKGEKQAGKTEKHPTTKGLSVILAFCFSWSSCAK